MHCQASPAFTQTGGTSPTTRCHSWGYKKKRTGIQYRGGASFSSKNSSILLTSVLTSPSNVMKGGFVPGARFCRSAGFLVGGRRLG